MRPSVLEALEPSFAAVVRGLLEACAKRGVELRPYCGVRTPAEQARLWRQGRTAEQITAAMDELRQGGAPQLAAVVGAVGPQHGARVTNAWPGASWHQHGLAVDCMLVEDGAAQWDAEAPGWAVYAAEAERLGLAPGRNWGDNPHVQQYSYEPTRFGLAKLNAAMVAKYPELAQLR